MGVWHIFLFSQTSNSHMFITIYPAHFPQTFTVKSIYCFSQWFEKELCVVCLSVLGCCCTTDSVTTQRTAPVPGWVWNTCLERRWKHLVINGLHLLLCSTCPLTPSAGFVGKSLTLKVFGHFLLTFQRLPPRLFQLHLLTVSGCVHRLQRQTLSHLWWPWIWLPHWLPGLPPQSE